MLFLGIWKFFYLSLFIHSLCFNCLLKLISYQRVLFDLEKKTLSQINWCSKFMRLYIFIKIKQEEYECGKHQSDLWSPPAEFDKYHINT